MCFLSCSLDSAPALSVPVLGTLRWAQEGLFWLLCPSPAAPGAPVTHCLVGELRAPTRPFPRGLHAHHRLLGFDSLGEEPLAPEQPLRWEMPQEPGVLSPWCRPALPPPALRGSLSPCFPPPPSPAASQGMDPSPELVGPQPWRQQLLSGGCQLCHHAVLSDGRSHLLAALSTGCCCCCCYRNTQLLTLTSFFLSLFSSSL